MPMKFADGRPYADPEAAARKLLEIANGVPAPQEGRIHIEKINGPMLYEHKATPAEYKAGLDLANRARLALAARERNLCEIHPGRRGAIRVAGTIQPDRA
jgi:hypothetical protein